MSIVVALTGNIASGKSTVARILSELGATVIYADQLARDVVQPGKPAYDDIVRHFGQKVLAADGSIDRVALGDIVFSDPQQRAVLESFTHPRISLAMFETIGQATASGTDVIVLEIPLLFEGNLHKQFPYTLVVTAPDHLRLQRIQDRDGLDEPQALARMESQMPQAEKTRLATWVIANDNGLEQLDQSVRDLWPRILDIGKARSD